MSLYLVDFNLVAYHFVRFHLIVILKQDANFSFAMRLIHFFCSSFILRVALLSDELYLVDFNLVACDFVRFHLIVILKQDVKFSFAVRLIHFVVVHSFQE